MSKCDKDTEITDQNLRQFVGYTMKRAFLMVREDLARVLEPLGLRMTSFPPSRSSRKTPTSPRAASPRRCISSAPAWWFWWMSWKAPT